ncbi:MAG: lipoprotein-releasing ABC transporter ATP-binding protein LolD [Gammaproteobacteria bacterium]|nr:lipoprotein-releasing ABC transporter ATP-binding protein LolD [Gammaproteobacteria bacterium]
MSKVDFSLQAIDLGKDYREGSGEALHVLRNINFTIKSGETAAIIGSSGSGKSTLLNLLGGLDVPTSGQVLVNDDNLFTINEKSRCHVRNRHLGFIYQFHHLLPEFSALENVAMPQLIDGVDKDRARERAVELLTEVGLGERLEHKPGELSGGERQRAAIARALINSPDCVLADEPTGNLDRKNAENALELIMQLNKSYKTSLIMVTHDMQIAERLDTVYELEDGILQLQ